MATSLSRDEISLLCEREVLGAAARLFGATQGNIEKFPDSEGCANLVYAYQVGDQERILRISFNPARPVEMIQAELDFINHLAQGGVRVSVPLPSERGNLIEVIPAGDIPFIAVSFVRGRGMRVPDNQYRYRPGVSIDEYFQNWGQVLGQMHRLARSYQPASEHIRRPDWYRLPEYQGFPYGERLPVIQEKYERLLAELHSLPADPASYGLIHNDFNDGNFTVDYSNGNITVFDFDDCCYYWYVYDLACAWEGGIGRAMFKPQPERIAFMQRYMDRVMEGYQRENTLGDEWLERLPLFLRVIQMQELIFYAQYLDEPDEELQAELRYKIHCISEDIPYLGFFDPVFNPEQPFCL